MDIVTAISTPIIRMVHAIDRLDWDGVRREFADTVEVDYTSLAGGKPETLSADRLMERWQGLLPGFEATQHLLGPFATNIRETSATVETHVRGYHYISNISEGNVWMVAGTYNFRLEQQGERWAIAAIQLIVFYQEGNLNLPGLAQSRAVESPRKTVG